MCKILALIASKLKNVDKAGKLFFFIPSAKADGNGFYIFRRNYFRSLQLFIYLLPFALANGLGMKKFCDFSRIEIFYAAKAGKLMLFIPSTKADGNGLFIFS